MTTDDTTKEAEALAGTLDKWIALAAKNAEEAALASQRALAGEESE